MSKTLHIGHQELTLEALEHTQHRVHFTLNEMVYQFQLEPMGDGNFILAQLHADNVSKRQTVTATRTPNGALRVMLAGQEMLVDEPRASRNFAQEDKPLSPRAPMPGLVRQILVKVGDVVTSGQALIVMEAMKLQMTLAAGGDGIIEHIAVTEGMMVEEGAELLVIVKQHT